jgi:hypothetical protein
MKRSELTKKWKRSVRQLIAILAFGILLLALSTGQKIWRHEPVLWLEVLKSAGIWLGCGAALYLFGLIITGAISQGCKED